MFSKTLGSVLCPGAQQQGTCHVSREEKPARRAQGDQGDRGLGSCCKTERGADRSRLDAAKNVS